MKTKSLVLNLFSIAILLCFIKCGPAQEDKQVMHTKAKRISDSIGKTVDSLLQVKPKQ